MLDDDDNLDDDDDDAANDAADDRGNVEDDRDSNEDEDGLVMEERVGIKERLRSESACSSYSRCAFARTTSRHSSNVGMSPHIKPWASR